MGKNDVQYITMEYSSVKKVMSYTELSSKAQWVKVVSSREQWSTAQLKIVISHTRLFSKEHWGRVMSSTEQWSTA